MNVPQENMDFRGVDAKVRDKRENWGGDGSMRRFSTGFTLRQVIQAQALFANGL